ncbi:MAG: 3-deoxy-D-manno-octulosonic acid transferase [Burkholderiaceae bacterium]|nr:MAG: 3-deoxy-D-manno-octulosonic acid transferase [Burkholderiaceae bacterium]
MNLPHALYDGAVWAVQPLVRRKLRRRGRAEPGYLEAVGERFGRYDQAPARPESERGDPLVWIHAVSLGETRTAGLLLKALRAQWPGMRLLLTNGTATGRAAGRAVLQPGDVQVWQPWDTRAATRAFMQRYRPDIGVLIETEIWPNLVRASRVAGMPLMLVNARLSDKSFKGALRVGRLLKEAYAGLAAVWAQTDEDAVRLRRLGAPIQGVLGNLKFDAVPDPALIDRGHIWRERSGARPVVMLASSREGEEAEFLDAIKAWAETGPRSVAPGAPAVAPQWLIVPRHPQRFDAVADVVRSRGFTVSRRSAWTDGPAPADVWLGDSLGEMTAYYALADVALLGGSFAPLGGQNLIEAAACGCPVVMGPHVFNFAEPAAQALRFDAAQCVDTMAQGVRAAVDLVGNEPLRAVMVKASLIFARKYQGAAARTAQTVRLCLEQARATEHP